MVDRDLMLRNILVHEHARLDPEIVVRVLRENLDDLARFRSAALSWVQVAG